MRQGGVLLDFNFHPWVSVMISFRSFWFMPWSLVLVTTLIAQDAALQPPTITGSHQPNLATILHPSIQGEVIYSQTIYPGEIVIVGEITEPVISVNQTPAQVIKPQRTVNALPEPRESHSVLESNDEISQTKKEDPCCLRPGTPLWEAVLDLVRQGASSDARADAAATVMIAKEEAHAAQITKLEVDSFAKAELLKRNMAEMSKDLEQKAAEFAKNAHQELKQMEAKLADVAKQVEARERQLIEIRVELDDSRHSLAREKQLSKQLQQQLDAAKTNPRDTAPKKRKPSHDKDRD